jgi:hypothetical protein
MSPERGLRGDLAEIPLIAEVRADRTRIDDAAATLCVKRVARADKAAQNLTRRTRRVTRR